MDITLVQKNVAAVAAGWSSELAARLERRALDKSDFATLRDAGLTLTGVPEKMGGVWQSGARSTRPTGAIFRTLARVDPSVALVATMHPTVLALWLEEPVAPPADPNAWREQHDRVLTAAKAGHWFGTISSESGGGGDLMATRATAGKGSDSAWRLTGEKQLGSGCDEEKWVATRCKAKLLFNDEEATFATAELAKRVVDQHARDGLTNYPVFDDG